MTTIWTRTMTDVIKSIEVELENGVKLKFEGRGSISQVKTQTPVKDEVPAQWPFMSWVTATLMLEGGTVRE